MSHLDLIPRWEELGQQLEKSITVYLEACTILESCSLVDPPSTRDLVSRINSRLNSFPTFLSGRLASARSSIARTRNKLVASALRLPDEILSGVFRLAMQSFDIEEPGQLSYKYRIRAIYRRLHTFIGVCSVWRRVGLESCFWTLVPLIDHPPGRYTFFAAQLSLERAANHRLHFAVCHLPKRPDIDEFIVKTLSKHGPRFDSMNLHSSSVEFISRSLSALLETVVGSPSSINDLSLYRSRSTDLRNIGFFLPSERLFFGGAASESAFKQVMESLRVLRICDLNLSFEGVSLRNLNHVRLQRVVVESKLWLSQFLRALVASSQLRTLEVISLLFATLPGDYSSEGLPISLPGLQHLYLEDTSLDALIFILESIAPGSHLVTFNWTSRCSHVVEDDRILNRYLQRGLNRFKIDALIFRQDSGETAFPLVLSLYFALKAIPTLTSLYLDSFVLQSDILHSLIPKPELESRMREMGAPIDSFPFPRLKKLYISRSHCHDLETLRDLPKIIEYHALEELGIGIGADCQCEGLASGIPVPQGQADIDSELERVWQSLGDSAPPLIRLPYKASEMPPTPWFESHLWGL